MNDDREYWEHFDHDSEVAKESKPKLDESVVSRMYAAEPETVERAVPQIQGLPAGQVLNLHNLLKLILPLQAQLAEQDRTIKKLVLQVNSLSRNSKTAGRSIDDLYHEMDRKVSRKD